ncbi:MAG: CHAT domain-containing protein [Desmonostoc vinosum HA7617-LM4]|nr:CHAT domain-containing protein [Desmonostoc vinosum HA7617-LM4]
MNEQRQQAYLNLIQYLLSCRSDGEIQEILAANQNLVDAGLVQKMLEVSSNLLAQRKLDQANRLMNIAGQKLGVYSYLSLTTTEQEYLDLLKQVLKATADSEGDAQVVYPLLVRNKNKLNEVLREILYRWGTKTLIETEGEIAELLAKVIFLFCNLIKDFSLGDKASNMEIAITGYKVVLNVYTRDAFSYQWAAVHSNLAVAYLYRIRGERAENLELAIAFCQEALKVYTLDAFPDKWARTQNNLGNAYLYRIRGERAENLEKAIASYTAALEVTTRNAFPVDWAMTQTNLGGAYIERIRGERAENLEQAIACFQEALKVYTLDAFPDKWAAVHTNIALAYLYRIRGERAENLELAITCCREVLKVYTLDAFPYEWAAVHTNIALPYLYRIRGERAENLEQVIAYCQEALKVYTLDAFPYEWARTQNNLGNAYLYRIRGERADNLELAIACCREVLKVYTLDAFPYEWARAQYNLGHAYLYRIRGKRVDNLEQAIACCQEALKVYTLDAFPYEWARTQNSLASVYSFRIKAERVSNLEQAIAFYQEALKVYTLDAFPDEWATTQNNLGLVFLSRIKGERVSNLEQAIACCQEALKVYTIEGFPQKYAESLTLLGIAYQKINQFTLAYNTFELAITTVESLREEIVSGEESKRKQAEQFNEVYSRMVEVCLELNQITEAIEYAEHSKTRNLVEQILERDSKTIFPLDDITQLETYRDKIAAGQYQIQNGKVKNPQDLAKRLQELRQQRNNLQDKYLPVGSGFKFDKFPETLDANTAVIEWYIATDTILTFIIQSHGQQLTSWQSPPEERAALIDWTIEYLNDYDNPEDEDKIQWQNQLETRLNKLAEILHIEEILAHIPEQCQRLILIPHRFLHLFPLHALPVKSSYLIDLFPKGVSYAPSCQILQQVQLRQHPESQSLLKSLFAVQNPTTDLYQDQGYEKDLGAVAAIKKKFTQAHIIKQANANKSAILHVDENHHTTLNQELSQANNIFFFCHGYFNSDSPLDSGLKLADANLTLTEIIAHFKLANCHLVTLSACETGMIDSSNTSDEYIGLPSGFLLAGSTNVVSSLWTVSTTATALFMIKFYEELQQQTNIVLALNAAQHWLRNTTTKGFQDWLPKSSLLISWQKVIDKHFTEIAKDKGESTQPFESPFYWAAFYHTGKGV